MFEKLKCKCDKKNINKNYYFNKKTLIAVIICFIIVITGGIVGTLFTYGIFDNLGFIFKFRGCM